ncbi:MAG: glycosyl hydrolase [Kiritimatiellae bacterium]|nr:glycosyl hydrolase [Kiritimatiellia bacterium]
MCRIRIALLVSTMSCLTASAALHEPEHGVYLGAYFPVESAQDITDFNLHAGKQHAVYSAFCATDDAFPWDWATNVTSIYPSAALHIAYEPMNGFAETFTNWTSGDPVYARMYSFATNCALFGGPVFLRFAHEANGTWYPWAPGYSDSDCVTTQTYIEGWRNVADLFHSNAPNVAMVWAATQGTSGPDSPMRDYAAVYPGDDWVDWVGISVYNGDYYGNKDPVMDDQLAKAIEYGYYEEIPTAQNFYYTFSDPDNTNGHRKPMMIAETASLFEPAYSATDETVVAAFESLTGGQLVEEFESTNGMWGGWNNLAAAISNEAYSGTGALWLTVSAVGNDGWYVGGTGCDITPRRDWSTAPSFYIYAKRTAGDAVNPNLVVGLQSGYEHEGDEVIATWANCEIESTNYARLELSATALAAACPSLVWTNITALRLMVLTTQSNVLPANVIVDTFGVSTSAAPDQIWWTVPWGLSTWELSSDAAEGTYALRMGGTDAGGGYIGGNGCCLAGKTDWSDCDGIAFYAKRGTNAETKPWLRIELDSDGTDTTDNSAILDFSLQNTGYSRFVVPFSLFECSDDFSFAHVERLMLHLLTHTYGVQPADVYLDHLEVGTYTATNTADAMKNQQDWMQQLFALSDYSDEDPDDPDANPDYVDISRRFKNLHMVNWFYQDMIEDGRYVDFRIFRDGGSEPIFDTYHTLIGSPYFLSRVVIDQDGNGMDDVWEKTYFGETDVDPDEDADGDGMSNLNEYRTATVPTNAASVFRLDFDPAGTMVDNEIQLTWTGREGLFYRIEKTESLSEPFTILTNGIKGASGACLFINTPEEPVAQLFYRITQE